VAGGFVGRALLALAFSTSAALAAHAAEFRPAAHETWSGTYECGPLARDPDGRPGYTSAIKATLDGRKLSISKKSSGLRETMTGVVSDDGRVVLRGTGRWKSRGSHATWQFRFEGEFEGKSFSATGAMLTQSRGTKLRDCSMRLRQVSASGPREQRSTKAAEPTARPPEPQRPASASAASDRTAVAAASPVSKASVAAAPAAGPASAAALRRGIERDLDLAGANRSALVEAVVMRGAPDRYHVIAQKGQTLTLQLQAEPGAVRVDVYGPGAIATFEPTGLVVQGTRLSYWQDAWRFSGKAAEDGKYLILVSANRDGARYTIDVGVSGEAAGAQTAPPSSAPAIQSAPRGQAQSEAPAISESTPAPAIVLLLLGVLAAAAVLVVYRSHRVAVLTRTRAIAGAAVLAGGAAAIAAYLFVVRLGDSATEAGAGPRSAASTANEDAAKSAANAAGTPQVAPQNESAAGQSSAASAPSGIAGGTYVCGELKQDRPTSFLTTVKYFPDGVYLELAQTLSKQAATMTAVRMGTYALSGSTLVLRQLAASPNVEFGEPFTRTDLTIERELSGDLAKGYTSRTVRGASSPDPQGAAATATKCSRDDLAGSKMEQLRQELKAKLSIPAATASK
jgi:hypothetical protein